MGTENLYRTPAQARFRQLRDMANFASDGELAKFLGKDKSTISKYLSDDPKKRREPPGDILELFAMKLQARGGTNYGPPPRERILGTEPKAVQEVADQLREIHEHDPKGFKSVKSVVNTIYQTTKRGATRVKSAKEMKAEEDLLKAALTPDKKRKP